MWDGLPLSQLGTNNLGVTVNRAFYFSVSHHKISAALLALSLYHIIYVKPILFWIVYFFLSGLKYDMAHDYALQGEAFSQIFSAVSDFVSKVGYGWAENQGRRRKSDCWYQVLLYNDFIVSECQVGVESLAKSQAHRPEPGACCRRWLCGWALITGNWTSTGTRPTRESPWSLFLLLVGILVVLSNDS